jgi:hypothetical protein
MSAIEDVVHNAQDFAPVLLENYTNFLRSAANFGYYLFFNLKG